MASRKYLGCLALALAFALSARMAGKLLEHSDGPEAKFGAFLTPPEPRQLPRAVPQAIHTRPPLGDAAKELAMAQAGGRRLWIWDLPEYPR
jgi:hypothetical protein